MRLKSALGSNLAHHLLCLHNIRILSKHLLIKRFKRRLRVTRQRLNLLSIQLVLLLHRMTRVPRYVISLNDPISLDLYPLLLYEHLEMRDYLRQIILLFYLCLVLKVSLANDLHQRLTLLAKKCTISERWRNRKLLVKVVCEVTCLIGWAVLTK